MRLALTSLVCLLHTIGMITGELIREARERLGESQAKFAKRFGVVQSVVSRWESFGIPSNGSSKALVKRVLADIDKLDETVP